MAKAKKKIVKKVARKSVLKKNVDNRLSILALVLAIMVFVLAALSMS